MKLRSILLASLLAVSVASQPPQVSAQAVGDTDIEGFDSNKFVDYAGCAIGVGFAVGTGAWLIAGLACYKAFSDHWTT